MGGTQKREGKVGAARMVPAELSFGERKLQTTRVLRLTFMVEIRRVVVCVWQPEIVVSLFPHQTAFHCLFPLLLPSLSFVSH